MILSRGETQLDTSFYKINQIRVERQCWTGQENKQEDDMEATQARSGLDEEQWMCLPSAPPKFWKKFY